MSVILCGRTVLLPDAADELLSLHVQITDWLDSNVKAIVCVPDEVSLSTKEKRRLKGFRKCGAPVYSLKDYIFLLSSSSSSSPASSSSSSSSCPSSPSSIVDLTQEQGSEEDEQGSEEDDVVKKKSKKRSSSNKVKSNDEKSMKKKTKKSTESDSKTHRSASSVTDLLGMEKDLATGEKRVVKWQLKCPAATKVRMQRAQDQRLYLIEQTPLSSRWGNAKEFTILGSTGNVYRVEIGDRVRCNCPDAERGNVCKHQLFVFLRVLKQDAKSPYIYQKALLSRERAHIFDEAPLQADVVAEKKVREAYTKAVKGESQKEEPPTTENHRGEASDDCAICFEALGEEKLAVCPTCRNAIHSDCLGRWRSASSSNDTCPLCRSAWPSTSSSADPTISGGFLNLAAVAGIF